MILLWMREGNQYWGRTRRGAVFGCVQPFIVQEGGGFLKAPTYHIRGYEWWLEPEGTYPAYEVLGAREVSRVLDPSLAGLEKAQDECEAAYIARCKQVDNG